MRTVALVFAFVFSAGGTAIAQDIATTAYGAPTADWTGPYIGAQLGGSWAHLDQRIPAYGAVPDGEASGWLVGGYAGYYFQSGAFVLGAEFGVNWRDVSGTNSVNNDPERLSSEQHWDASLVAKVGVPMDQFLVYGLGGVAVSEVSSEFVGGFGPFASSRAYDTVFGWTAGAGVEAELADNLRARLEYRYAGFGEADVTCGTCGGAFITPSTHTVAAGLSFAF